MVLEGIYIERGYVGGGVYGEWEKNTQGEGKRDSFMLLPTYLIRCPTLGYIPAVFLGLGLFPQVP